MTHESEARLETRYSNPPRSATGPEPQVARGGSMCKEQRPAGTHQGQCHIDPKLRKRTPRRHAAGDCGDPPRQPVETRPPMFRRPWSEGFMNMPRALTRERDGRWRCAWLHVPFVSLSCPVDRVLDTDTEGAARTGQFPLRTHAGVGAHGPADTLRCRSARDGTCSDDQRACCILPIWRRTC